MLICENVAVQSCLSLALDFVCRMLFKKFDFDLSNIFIAADIETVNHGYDV
jgi:hypothetical protein